MLTTPLIREMTKQGRFYFLSRPRRFDKSLLVDTLQELLETNRCFEVWTFIRTGTVRPGIP